MVGSSNTSLMCKDGKRHLEVSMSEFDSVIIFLRTVQQLYWLCASPTQHCMHFILGFGVSTTRSYLTSTKSLCKGSTVIPYKSFSHTRIYPIIAYIVTGCYQDMGQSRYTNHQVLVSKFPLISLCRLRVSKEYWWLKGWWKRENPEYAMVLRHWGDQVSEGVSTCSWACFAWADGGEAIS